MTVPVQWKDLPWSPLETLVVSASHLHSGNRDMHNLLKLTISHRAVLCNNTVMVSKRLKKSPSASVASVNKNFVLYVCIHIQSVFML